MGLQPDQILHDRYRIVRIIKSGGMGSVYEAVDTKLADSPCAVKEIHEAAQASRESEYIQSRFFEEMKALVALDHGSIPKVRDYLTQENTIYIVMDLVQGRSLDEEIQERVAAGIPAPVDYIVLDMVRLLETLAYLHGQNPPVIHRDIKPANILRDSRSGVIKVVDFGLARSLHGPNTQTVVGTMGYCAPEQLMGKSEQRSDLYSVGVTMAHLLTGKTPEMDLFEARRPELPGVRPGLVDIIARATQPKPQDRYASCEEMAQALQTWLHRPSGMLGGSVPPTAKMAPESTREPIKLPSWAGKAAAAAIILGSLCLGVWAGQRRKPESASQALVPTAPTPTAVAKAKPKPKKPAPAVAQKPAPPPVQASSGYQPPVASYPAPRPVAARPPAPKPKAKPQPPPVRVTYQPPVEPYRAPKRRHRSSGSNYRPPPPQPAFQVSAGSGGVRVSAPAVEREVQNIQRQIPRGLPF